MTKLLKDKDQQEIKDNQKTKMRDRIIEEEKLKEKVNNKIKKTYRGKIM